MRTKPAMWTYLRGYRQDDTMLWIWRILMIMALVNMVLALITRRWYDALTEFVIAAFIMRITILERYISDCNDYREKLEREIETKEEK